MPPCHFVPCTHCCCRGVLSVQAASSHTHASQQHPKHWLCPHARDNHAQQVVTAAVALCPSNPPNYGKPSNTHAPNTAACTKTTSRMRVRCCMGHSGPASTTLATWDVSLSNKLSKWRQRHESTARHTLRK